MHQQKIRKFQKGNQKVKGKKHHEHVHPNSIVSGVFYFQINENLQPDQLSKRFHEESERLGGVKVSTLALSA